MCTHTGHDDRGTLPAGEAQTGASWGLTQHVSHFPSFDAWQWSGKGPKGKRSFSRESRSFLSNVDTVARLSE